MSSWIRSNSLKDTWVFLWIFELILSLLPLPLVGVWTLKFQITSSWKSKSKTHWPVKNSIWTAQWHGWHVIRHGIVNTENEPNFVGICSLLHRKLDIFVMWWWHAWRSPRTNSHLVQQFLQASYGFGVRSIMSHTWLLYKADHRNVRESFHPCLMINLLHDLGASWTALTQRNMFCIEYSKSWYERSAAWHEVVFLFWKGLHPMHVCKFIYPTVRNATMTHLSLKHLVNKFPIDEAVCRGWVLVISTDCMMFRIPQPALPSGCRPVSSSAPDQSTKFANDCKHAPMPRSDLAQCFGEVLTNKGTNVSKCSVELMMK